MRRINTSWALGTLAAAALLTLNAGCGAIEVGAGTHEPGKSHSTVNGSVRIGADSEIKDASSVNGSVHVGEAAAVRDAETVNGRIMLARGSRARSVATVNGSIKAEREVQIEGDVGTINGSVELSPASRVGGKVETVNGYLGLTGVTVAGNVESYNGSIMLTDGAVVEGDLLVKKPKMGKSWNRGKMPKVVIGPQSEVRGELRFDREVRLFVHDSASIGTVTGAEAKRYSGDEPG